MTKDKATTPTQACYWIIGLVNKSQAPAVAIELHATNGDVVVEARAIPMRHRNGKRSARQMAVAYAREHEIDASNVHYDLDSTEAFGGC
jgi:hypothetical protein